MELERKQTMSLEKKAGNDLSSLHINVSSQDWYRASNKG